MALAAKAAANRSTDRGARAGEETGDDPTREVPRKTVFTRRRKLIIAVPPLLLGLVGAALWSTGTLKRLSGGSSGTKKGVPTPQLFAMPELITNLDGSPNVERYVKADIRLVVAGRAALAAVRSHEPELQDMFLSYLRDMRPGELERPTSTWRLREALLERAAVVVGPGRVTNVLFTNLLVQ